MPLDREKNVSRSRAGVIRPSTKELLICKIKFRTLLKSQRHETTVRRLTEHEETMKKSEIWGRQRGVITNAFGAPSHS